jgi:hypothetical protein
MQLRAILFIACSALLLSVSFGQIASHKITTLPGLTFTPNFNQYAGYLTLPSGRGYFYWYESKGMDRGTYIGATPKRSAATNINKIPNGAQVCRVSKVSCY